MALRYIVEEFIVRGETIRRVRVVPALAYVIDESRATRASVARYGADGAAARRAETPRLSALYAAA